MCNRLLAIYNIKTYNVWAIFSPKFYKCYMIKKNHILKHFLFLIYESDIQSGILKRIKYVRKTLKHFVTLFAK
jgi:hypothetical protein